MADHFHPLRTLRLAGVASVALFAVGCATVNVPAPTAQLAAADAAIADAVSADAARYDAADLGNAQRKIARAHDGISQGNYATARDLAEEPEVDARLAATHSRATKAADADASIRASIRALNDEIARAPQ